MKIKWLVLYVVLALFVLSIPAVYSYFSPKIISQPPLDSNKRTVLLIGNEPFPYQPEVRFDIPVTWHLMIPLTTSGSRLQVSINPDTGEIVWNDKRKGIWELTVTASNWAGRDSQTFIVKHIIKPFIKINLPTTITAQQNFKGSLDITGSRPIKLSCSHPDIKIEDADNFKPQSFFYWKKPKAGKYSIGFTASNPAGKHTRNWNVTVKGKPVRITSEPQKTTATGIDYKYQVKAIGTPKFQWQLEDAPEGMSIGSKGIVLWPADSAKEGNYTVSIKVSNIIDGSTYTDTQIFTLQCKKKQEEEKVEKQKKKQSKKLTNVNIKRVFKEDKIIKKQKKIIQDQKKLLEELPKQFKPEQKKAIDAQKEAIKKAEEAKERALQLKKQKAEEERLEAEREEKERQRIEAEKLKEILRQQEEAERQKILDAQKEADKRKAERQRLLKEQREKERREALHKQQEKREKQEEAREKYLETQRKAEEKAKREEAARLEAQHRKQEALRVQKEEAQKRAERLKQQEIALRKRQEEAKRKQEEARRKYQVEQQKLREAAEKARLRQEEAAERIKRQKKLKKQAKEAERIAKKQREIEEELRKQGMTKKVSVPTKRDMSREKIEKGKKIDLRYDFVMTGWSFADFNRLVRSRQFKILFMPMYKSIQPENYEVTGLDGNGNPVVQKRSWDDGHYASKGCIVVEIPTEGEDHWKDYVTNLRRKLRVGSHTLTLFFPYHFFTYLEEAAKSYYDVHKVNPDISFKQGAGKIKFTITKNYKFKILSMGNTR